VFVKEERRKGGKEVFDEEIVDEGLRLTLVLCG
jgi:hypothetical protein